MILKCEYLRIDEYLNRREKRLNRSGCYFMVCATAISSPHHRKFTRLRPPGDRIRAICSGLRLNSFNQAFLAHMNLTIYSLLTRNSKLRPRNITSKFSACSLYCMYNICGTPSTVESMALLNAKLH